MVVTSVIKRDKSIVSFNRDKIFNAVLSAFKSYTKKTKQFENDIRNIVNAVVRKLTNEETVDVELIQDIVEVELIKKSHYKVAKLYIEYRTKQEIKRKQTQLKLPNNVLPDFITTSRYSSYDPVLKRRETANEAYDKLCKMHTDKNPQISEELKWAFEMMKKDYILPSMRSLQFKGSPILKHHERMFNCTSAPIDKLQRFSELMYLLLCGCGCGFAVDYEHVEKLPKLAASITDDIVIHYTIEDSIEGWAHAIDKLVQSFVDGNIVEFNYSQIRPKGSPISSGGKAPGHYPLRLSIERVREILTSALGRKLKPIEVFDICCHISDSVLAGGVRRSALICIFSFDDHEMKLAKTGNWFETNPQRARANISGRLLRNEISKRQFKRFSEAIHEFGEPGFFLSNSIYETCNPCAEITFYNRIDYEDGSFDTGWQACNLSTINGTKIKSAKQFYEAARAASIIGTSQASFDNWKFFDKTTNDLLKREALIGVSMTSILAHPNITLSKNIVQRAAVIVNETNTEMALKIGINPAARTTCVKPEGTTTLKWNSMLPGIHPAHAKRVFKRVQMNKNNAVYKFFKKHNPHMCEESVWSTNGTDDVITFPLECEEDALLRDNVTGLNLLNIVLKWQLWWVQTGQQSTDYTNSHNNVSNTITYREEEWGEMMKFIWKYKESFTGIAFLKYENDKKYPQAPNEAVATEGDLQKFYYLVENYVPVDYTQLHEEEDNTEQREELACAGGACTL